MLEQLVHKVEGRLFALLRGGGDREDAISDLQAEIAREQERLNTTEQRRKALAERLKTNEETVVLLPSQIESSVRRGKASQALRQALELDRIRRELVADREELPRVEQACWSLSFSLRQMRRQFARMLAEKRRR